MDRRTLIVSGLVTLGAAGVAKAQTPLPPARPRGEPEAPPPPNSTPSYPTGGVGSPAPPDTSGRPSAQQSTYSEDEIVHNVSDFLGVTAESAGGAVERIFKSNGRPTAYIAGEEGSGAIAVGLRYGRGLLYMKGRQPTEVFWRGPSIGWDFGGNASRVFTLCYDLEDPRDIFQRFPGVDGSAYFIGGLGVNYQRTDDIVLAPIRAGVGFRLGANVGYLAYSRKRNFIPF
ncbi:MAG TPA: EipA family protein [Phenylobacterium sp.]|jgi:hypothetical protein|uniref:DUF1134 domain-containing protein n=1 Tax=Phenylobacterium sp. TaxID=1871053 RepID=UPI002D3641F9|nr:EipA family protein [Phenylobacterium sp.]HZZ68480.1 EipA family protein [Phenylobacterium sp.]